MGGGLNAQPMALRIFTSLVTLKLLSSRLSTEDTPTSHGIHRTDFQRNPRFRQKGCLRHLKKW